MKEKIKIMEMYWSKEEDCPVFVLEDGREVRGIFQYMSWFQPPLQTKE
jgi:hypothetical protein